MSDLGLNSWKGRSAEVHLVERGRTTDVARQHDTGRSQGDEKKKEKKENREAW